MSSYLDYMYKFEISTLKDYLGTDIIDTLIEWLPNGDTLLTRKRLIKMIDSLYGVNILKNKEFRKDLLLSMDIKDILVIRDECLSKEEKQISNPLLLVKCIANKVWGKIKYRFFF